MYAIIGILLVFAIAAYVSGKVPVEDNHRQGRFFPYHTIGRFTNDPCQAANGLTGTCVLKEECADNSGFPTGSCPTSQLIPKNAATCCVYQMGCNTASAQNNTYFSNTNYPNAYAGGTTCTYKITKCAESICQLRVDFLVMDLAPPDGNGFCKNDAFVAEGVPNICGFNSGQHVYINFGESPDITISIRTSSKYSFGRRWNLQVTQIDCASPVRAPAGCLQYYSGEKGTVSSFNYQSSPSSALNKLQVPGTRQLSGIQYGICVQTSPDKCSIEWTRPSNDPYAFTLTNDVQSIPPGLLGNGAVSNQACEGEAAPIADPCLTDYVVIPDAMREGRQCLSDRFCGLGLPSAIVSNVKPFVLYVVTDDNEDQDIGNRGFQLAYEQKGCDGGAK